MDKFRDFIIRESDRNSDFDGAIQRHLFNLQNWKKFDPA